MAQPGINLQREAHKPPLSRLQPAVSNRLLATGCCLLIAYFYLAAFFPQPQPLKAAAFGFLGLSVLAGLVHATSVPAAFPLLFGDVVHVMLGTLAVQLAIQAGGMAAVQAAALVGALGWLGGQLSFLEARVHPASLYCGAFAGMTSSHLFPGSWWMTLAGMLAGIVYSLSRHFWVGIGGGLGTIVFSATSMPLALARFAGFNHRNLVPASVDASVQLAIVGVAVVSVCLTYWLSEHRKFGAVFASAVPTTLLVFGTKLLDPSWQLKTIPLVAAWLGASFAGMTSAERLAGRHWMLPLMGLIFGFLLVGSGPTLYGFGGVLGATALVAVLAGLGIARLSAVKTVFFSQARQAVPSAAPAGQ
jgi:hypothetical protein